MAENSGEPQRSAEQLTDAELNTHIEGVNAKLKSPEQRALEVYAYLRESKFTTWDVLCFCVNWMGAMSAVWPWLEMPVKVLSGLVYKAHYFFTDKVLGEESKLE